MSQAAISKTTTAQKLIRSHDLGGINLSPVAMFNLSLIFQQLGKRIAYFLGAGFTRDKLFLCILNCHGLFVPPPLSGFLSDFPEFLCPLPLYVCF